ncbi:sugar kinase [Streptomyces sp. NPDC048297]|uniref:sugar kinase n=1 Tax=Streptomyces sp. NPDC048297 TaxID=3365531 RepID=UPI00371CC649
MTTPPASHAIAIDLGTRFLRVARTGPDGTPELVELPGTVPGEGLPTPAGVSGDRGAALRMAYTRYREQCGTPGKVVLVVPPQERAVLAREWAVPPQGRVVPPGDGGMPRPRLLDTPHAVLALLRHAGTRLTPRLLVCDLGASAAEVTECAVAGGSVADGSMTGGSVADGSMTGGFVAGGSVPGRSVSDGFVAVVRVARYAPADDGYGAAFDAAVLAGAGLPDDDPDVLRELGRARARNARRIEVALDRMAARPDRADRFADTVVHEVAGREITAGLVHRALTGLTDGLDRALDGLTGGTPGVGATGQDPSRTPVIAVGGPARSGALLRHLTGRLGRSVPVPGGTDPALAAVFGAALVAGGHIDPADRYPHAVAVRVHRTVVGRPRDGELLVSPPGTLEPGGATVFAEAGGERVRVRTGPADGTGGTGGRDVRILVRAAGTGDAAPVGVVRVPVSGEGVRFHLGVRLAADGTARLVLQPLGRGGRSSERRGLSGGRSGRSGEQAAEDRVLAHPPPEEFPLGVLPIDLRSDSPADPPSDFPPDSPSNSPSDPTHDSEGART